MTILGDKKEEGEVGTDSLPSASIFGLTSAATGEKGRTIRSHIIARQHLFEYNCTYAFEI